MPVSPKMRAMVLNSPGQPLELRRIDIPQPGPGQVLIRVKACGVCRTDLHIIDGELTNPKIPLIPGHEIVGTVVGIGAGVERFGTGDRVGVPWLGYSCGKCRYCQRNQENLCDNPRFTGYTIDGGYAEYTVADQRYCFRVPEEFGDIEAAPLLCAGLIGYRSYRMLNKDVQRLGIYGFGAAAHIIAQIAEHEGKSVYAFTRPGDLKAQEFARQLGAVWAGDSTQAPPEQLEAAIILAPVGALVPRALRVIAKGGSVICGGIHMSDIPSFPYEILWGERMIRSVANLTRQDGEELFKIAPKIPIKTSVQVFELEDANNALNKLRNGQIEGAAILKISD